MKNLIAGRAPGATRSTGKKRASKLETPMISLPSVHYSPPCELEGALVLIGRHSMTAYLPGKGLIEFVRHPRLAGLGTQWKY